MDHVSYTHWSWCPCVIGSRLVWFKVFYNFHFSENLGDDLAVFKACFAFVMKKLKVRIISKINFTSTFSCEVRLRWKCSTRKPYDGVITFKETELWEALCQKSGNRGDWPMIVMLWSFFVAVLQISHCEKRVVAYRVLYLQVLENLPEMMHLEKYMRKKKCSYILCLPVSYSSGRD